MNAFEIKMLPNSALMTPVLAAVRSYAESFFSDKKDLDRIVLSAEEAIGNVLRFSQSRQLTDITVTLDADGGEFTVCVLDQGLPGNFEETLQGDDRLGLTLMHNAMDVVQVENLGLNGRCQKLVKYYSKMPDWTRSDTQEAESIIENAVITVRAPKKSDMLAICRALYDEYGLTYPNEIVYYPDRFYAAVAKDQIHSTVAVDENDNLAGHHGVSQWSIVPGIWEFGMAIVNNRYRNAGVFVKMMQRTYNYVHDEVRTKMFMGACTTTHPYSQKLRLKYGSMPCGFSLNALPNDVGHGTFIKDGHFTHEAYAASVFDFSEKTVYLPKELQEPAQFIYGGLKLPRIFAEETGEPEADLTDSAWLFNKRSRNGSVNIRTIGKDFASRLKSDILELRTRGAEMITLYGSLEDSGFPALYSNAKTDGFFFTSILPNADQGDVVVMQKMLKSAVDYENIITVEPFTTLLDMIRALDPDQQR